MSQFSATNGTNPIYDPIRDHNGYRSGARVARVQILIALFLGLSAFTVFCFLRKKYPRIYVANFNQLNINYFHSFSRQKLPKLPSTLFGWIPVVYRIDEKQVLEHAGLDAVVFLGFFKMSIKILAVCVVFAFTIISPVRYKYTGRVDFPDGNDDDDDDDKNGDDDSAMIKLVRLSKRSISCWLILFIRDSGLDDYESFLWMYTVFTYVFTLVVLYLLYRQTTKIVAMRQNYLGQQSSITDRTIKLSGIPPVLREEEALKRHINSLGVGDVDEIVIVKEWNTLNDLFRMRKRILRRLEVQWVEYFKKNGLDNTCDLRTSRISASHGDTIHLTDSDYLGVQERPGSPESATSTAASIIDQISEHLDDHSSAIYGMNTSVSHLPLLTDDDMYRPRFRKGFFGLFGPDVDSINYYNEQLEVLDKEIRRSRLREYPPSSTAILTMKSVAQAQMLAQAVLDPKVNHLITSLAPAPHDIIWDNLCLSRRERNFRISMVMIFIGLISILLVFPVRFLSNFLNVKSISKVTPKLGEFLKGHRWAETLITGILPPYVFTIFNIVMPYFYIWITQKQGYTSHGDEELSSVSKNFFYIFVNLFLVFTLFGTVTLSDTAPQIAYQLAQSLKKLSLFYVDLIILQGIGIFPYKLLLLGNLLKYPIGNLFWCKTPRDYLNLYKPPVFNFGLQLPQPILILIITITYSVISTKIVTAGLIYFIVGYFVFKYQLLYACIHPPHNTGKVWPLMVRRVILGLLIFHMTMFGTLASEKAILCASLLVPLPLFTGYVFWYYHKHYTSLSTFIALRSIVNNELPFRGDDEEELFTAATNSTAREQTLDERREVNQSYEYPYLYEELNGPMIAVDHDEVLHVSADGAPVRKSIPIL